MTLAKARGAPKRPAVGAVVDGRFAIVRLIGEGSASLVFAAEHRLLGHEVALKCLKVDGRSPKTMTRVRREARAALALRFNPHVATVHDVGLLESGAPYLVMELLRGQDLAAHQRARGVLAIEEAIDIALQVCAALAEAHACGLVHRDVKPSNVFLSEPARGPADGSWHDVRLLDFGVCKFVRLENARLDETVTTQSSILGCPHYMAPEQVRAASRVDGRCDVWSVGVLLHRMLTGAYPFEGENALAMLAAILSSDPISLRVRRADVSRDLARVVSHALARNVDERLESASALARALAPFASERGRAFAARFASGAVA